MRKTNKQIEIECAQNWLQTYRELKARGKHVPLRKEAAMRMHLTYLKYSHE